MSSFLYELSKKGPVFSAQIEQPHMSGIAARFDWAPE
ncbi:hypothetical protein M2324_002976 [Rhodovulum sulfidophilum]|nr:hypothetical protein [Rhodovulum sulfidophilum]